VATLDNPIAVAIKELSFSYRGSNQPALNNVNLIIRRGEFLGITGPTGAGKTTLAQCVNGVIPHFIEGTYRGDVLLKGRSVFELSGKEISRWVGSVFQDPEAQLVSANVEEELAFGPENMAVAPVEIEQRIEFALNSVGIGELRGSSIETLSGGQKQRVAIAAVLAMQPEIIVLDEPTAELDPIGTNDVFKVLERLNREFGLTIIIIEHKLEQLSQYCQRLLIMDEGRIVIDGTPDRIFEDWQKIREIGVKPPQVTELFWNLPEFNQKRQPLPVTLEEAKTALDKILSDN